MLSKQSNNSTWLGKTVQTFLERFSCDDKNNHNLSLSECFGASLRILFTLLLSPLILCLYIITGIKTLYNDGIKYVWFDITKEFKYFIIFVKSSWFVLLSLGKVKYTVIGNELFQTTVWEPTKCNRCKETFDYEDMQPTSSGSLCNDCYVAYWQSSDKQQKSVGKPTQRIH